MKRAVLAAAVAVLSFVGFAGTTKKSVITVVGCDAGTSLADFPVLVRLSPEGLDGFNYADCAAGGADLRFTLTDGTPLRHEIDQWNVNGESLVWVKLPMLTPDAEFVLRWGDSSAKSLPVSQTDGSVWKPSGHLGVWHAAEAQGHIHDATGGGHDARSIGDVASAVAVEGVVGHSRANALGEATCTQLLVDHDPDLCTYGVFTLSAWAKIFGFYDSPAERNHFAFGKSMTWNCYAGGWMFENYSTFLTAGASHGTNLFKDDSEWHHYIVSVSNTVLKCYRDGVQVYSGTLTKVIGDIAAPISLGGSNNATYPGFRSCWDEIRYRKVPTDEAWAKAEYQTTQPGFLAFGEVAEEPADVSVAPIEEAAEVFVPVHTYYVSTSGSDDEGVTGLSSDDAFLSVSRALAVAEDGDLIRVLAGNHVEMTPVVNPLNAACASLGVVTKAVHIVGDGETDTVLTCHYLGTTSSSAWMPQGFYVNNPAAVVSDLAVVGHNGGLYDDDNHGEIGSAFHVLAGTVERCRVTASAASGNSSGRESSVALGCAGRFIDCIVTNNNTAGWCKGTGGILSDGGLVRRCVVDNNQGSENRTFAPGIHQRTGGRIVDTVVGRTCPCPLNGRYYAAVYANGGVVERTVIVGATNTTSSGKYAAGAYMSGSAMMRNVLVSRCYQGSGSGNEASGIYATDEAEICHVTVVDNVAKYGYSGVELEGNARLYGSILNGNAATSATQTENLVPAGRGFASAYPEADGTNGNISADPSLEKRDEPLPQTPDEIALYTGYMPHGASPARNITTLAGNYAFDDLRGRVRPVYSASASDTPDMGAHEIVVDTLSVRLKMDSPTVLEGDEAVVFAEPSMDEPAITKAVWTLRRGESVDTVETASGTLTYSSGAGLYSPGNLSVSVTVTFADGQEVSAAEPLVFAIAGAKAFVSKTGSATYPYDTWAKATPNLCDAIEVVGSSDSVTAEIRIADGVYDSMKTVLVQNCDSLGQVVKPVHIIGNEKFPTNVVLKFAVETPCGGLFVGHDRARLSGVTLTGTAKTATPEVRGGALHLSAGTVSNCVFTGCVLGSGYSVPVVTLVDGLFTDCTITNCGPTYYAWPRDGATILRIVDGTAERCRIVGNSTWEIDTCHGMVVLETAKSVLRDSVISGNTVTHQNRNTIDAGVVYQAGGLLERCKITGNVSKTQGRGGWAGGVYQTGGRMVNCLVADNEIDNNSFNVAGARAVYWAESKAETVNCTIAGNVCLSDADDSVAGLYLNLAAAPQNMIVCGNAGGRQIRCDGSSTCAYSVTNGVAGFRAPEKGDYSISSSSPAVNAGNPQTVVADGETDLAGRPRLRFRRIDAGCYESQVGGTVIIVR